MMIRKNQIDNSGLKLSIIIIFFIALTLIIIGYQEVNRLYSSIENNITRKLNENANTVNHILESSEIQLDLLSEVIAHQHHKDPDELSDPVILPETNQYFFYTDESNELISLSGIGNYDSFNSKELEEIAVTHNLQPYFKTANDNLQGIQWMYFISKNRYIYLYPPASKDDYLFTQDTLEKEFYTKTLPENNPNQSIVMTDIYTDEAGAGLMITLSKPIYHADEYLGSLSLDYTLRQIDEIIKSHSLIESDFILFNESEEILACSCSDNTMLGITLLDEKLSELKVDKDFILEMKPNQFYIYDGYLIKMVSVPNRSWKILGLRSMSSIYSEMLVEELPLIVLFVSLVITVLLYLKKTRNDTEIINSKLKFEQVVEQTVQLMAILDTNGRILFVNQTARGMIGYEDDALIGELFSHSPWWSWSEELIHFIEDAVIKTNQGLSIKKDVVHYDTIGVKHHVEFTMNPIYNKGGKIEYLAANGKDITDRILLKESMDKLTKLDMLTNLSNRRGITETIQNEISRYNRTGDTFSILLFDIDYFKRVNDTYGHNVGDEVLIALSQYLQLLVRDYDVVGRWGGEEFLIVLPNTRYEEAMELGKRIRKSIKTMDLDCMDQDDFNHITLTIGVTEFNPEYDINAIIKQADDALYYGKNHGRDQVIGHKDMKMLLS